MNFQFRFWWLKCDTSDFHSNVLQRLVQVVGADFGERSCPKDTELRNENPQLAYHRTRPAICTLLQGVI